MAAITICNILSDKQKLWARKQKLARKSSRFVVVEHEPVKVTRQRVAKVRREDLKGTIFWYGLVLLSSNEDCIVQITQCILQCLYS